MTNGKIKNLLTKKIVILDGATGTELQKKGMPAGACPESWCLENPQVIKDIHVSYQQAGAPLGDAFKEPVRGLIDGGCDLIVIETMIDIQETRAALLAVKEIKDIFTIVSMTYEEDAHTLSGTDPVSALITLQSLGADAVGCNCSTGPEKMVDLIAAMKPYATVALKAKPHPGA